MKKLANVFLNGVEVSAQEATYGVLGIPLTNSSRDCTFIATGPPEERIIFVKTDYELRNMDGESTEIAAKGPLDHYSQRPDEIEDLCLADFAAWYTFSRKRNSQSEEQSEHEEEEETLPGELVNDIDGDEEPQEVPKVMRLKDKSGFIRKRRVQRIVRFRKYGEKQDPENYFREQLMLYVPWRNEETELVNIEHQARYRIMKEQIASKKNEYNKLEVELAVTTNNDEDESDTEEEDQEYAVMGGYEGKADIMKEIFQERNNPQLERIPVPGKIDEGSYRALITSLNTRQEQYLCHVIHSVRNNIRRLEYVYGGAGKYHLITKKNVPHIY
jgi:hypothetical protein